MAANPKQTLHAVGSLWRLMDQLAVAQSVERVYYAALGALAESLDVHRAAVLLYDEDGIMRFVASEGISERYRAAVEGHSPWPREADVWDPVLVPDAMRDPGFALFRDAFAREEIGALAFIPLSFGDELLGKFMLYYDEPHEFEERELAVARAIASHIAYALEHRRIEAELESRLQDEQRVHARLRESESRLRLALEAGNMGTWEWSIDDDRVIWSNELQALHGIRPGAFEGTFEAAMRDLHPEDRERALEEIREAVEGNPGDYATEYRIILPSGEKRWVEVRGRVVVDDAGRPARMLGICGDVTRRKWHERAQLFMTQASALLQSSLEAEETLRNITHLAVPRIADWCALYLVDDHGQIQQVEVAHYKPELAEFAREWQRRWPAQREGAIGAVIASGEPLLRTRVTDADIEASARDPEHLAMMRKLDLHSVMVVPLKTRERTLGAISLVSSGSHREYHDEDLVLALELASRAALAIENSWLYQQSRHAVKARDEVLAVVSHDLRNPISTILTACAIHDLPVPDEKKARARATIERAARQMENLIEDLLDVSRIEAGRLVLERQPVELRSLAADAIALFAPIAEDKAVRLHCEFGADCRVLGDRERLMQVMSNLLGNAVKFVRGGGDVWISGRIDGGFAVVEVRDNGVGIPSEQLPHLFDRFWQGSNRERDGAGLGLAIAKGIVDAHGGRIEVSSTLGEGTTFAVWLPT